MIENRQRRRMPGRKAGLAFASVFLVSVSCAATGPAGGTSPGNVPIPARVQDPKPRAVVFLVVDQLRGDLLDRYAPAFTGGFKRLKEDGLSFSLALHDHATTETAPGHAALSTGTNPARAGIPSNGWREGSGRDLHPVANVVDPDHALVGVPGLPGSSPEVLTRTGLADWILAADSRAKVVSVSAKDRAAVLMAGKSRGEVFWFNSQAGRFVTSTFYREENPDWLESFNAEVMLGFRADTVWSSTIPAGTEDLSSPDTADFEADGINTFFPHRYALERIDPGMDDFFLWFEGTPMLDDATMRLAKVAVTETGLGKEEGRTDFLSVSFSQTDRVGHAYGPLSREQMDNLVRLDRLLGDFLDFLDREIGKGRYVLGLSADHGVMTVPERLPGGGDRLTMESRSVLEQALNRAVREASVNPEVPLANRMLAELRQIPFVGPAYLRDSILAGAVTDSIGVLYQHSVVPSRMGGLLGIYGVEMWWAPNTLDWGFPTGTTHGGPYFHDRWVPLILVGAGIEAGVTEVPVMPVDLAPTLAWLAGISYPEDLDGTLLPVR